MYQSSASRSIGAYDEDACVQSTVTRLFTQMRRFPAENITGGLNQKMDVVGDCSISQDGPTAAVAGLRSSRGFSPMGG